MTTLYENSANYQQDIIRQMARLRDLIHETPNEYKHTHLREIENNLLEYIHEFCVHSIVQDSIDVSPEKSQTIYYCEICETDFTKKIE
jgi:hypothetical protein